MSDPGIEEESLISQDDIDALLDTSSIEADETQIDASGLLDDDPESGELSQDDIDSLMGNPVTNDGGELSQDDIDSLMDFNPPPGDEGDEEDLELISQDDIDHLMNPSADRDDTQAENDLDGGDDELISMDDIQGLINAESSEDPPEEEPEPGVDPAAQEMEVKAVLEDDGDSLDAPIDEFEAMAVADCLVTQEVMDGLMENAGAQDVETDVADFGDPVVDSQILSPLDMGGEDDDFPADDPIVDLDQILESDDLDLDPDGDVTQEDIDALLQESDDDDDFLDEDDDILISQDDIDTLLMAADQEDEDVLGDLMGDEADFEMDDIMGDDGPDNPEIDQVVLEGGEDTPEEDTGESKRKKPRGLFKSKLFLAVASVILVLGITVPLGYFLFFSDEAPPLVQRESIPPTGQDNSLELEVASVLIDEDISLPVTRLSGTVVLPDFVILASDLTKKMTYVYADISIDYSDQRAYHEINSNLSFYRDLIYGAIQTRLVSEKRDEVTESDLIWGVETSLKKVLPPQYIKKISFKTFRTS